MMKIIENTNATISLHEESGDVMINLKQAKVLVHMTVFPDKIIVYSYSAEKTLQNFYGTSAIVFSPEKQQASQNET